LLTFPLDYSEEVWYTIYIEIKKGVVYMRDKQRLFEDCRHYGERTFSTDFQKDNGAILTIQTYFFEEKYYTFTLLSGRVEDLIID
jgi:hypothetical protein